MYEIQHRGYFKAKDISHTPEFSSVYCVRFIKGEMNYTLVITQFLSARIFNGFNYLSISNDHNYEIDYNFQSGKNPFLGLSIPDLNNFTNVSSKIKNSYKNISKEEVLAVIEHLDNAHASCLYK